MMEKYTNCFVFNIYFRNDIFKAVYVYLFSCHITLNYKNRSKK
jgi:hypothetical protein